MTSFKKKLKTNLICSQMEDNFNLFSNGIRPQYTCQLNMTSKIKTKQKMPPKTSKS